MTQVCANRRILHASPTLLAKSGTLALETNQLCNAICRISSEVHLALITRESDRNAASVLANDIQVVKVSQQESFGSRLKAFQRKTTVDIIHQHGIWMQSMRDVSAFARARKVPLVLSLHGMLDPAILRHRALQKKLDMLLYQRKDLRSATALHATTLTEVEQIRALRLKQPVILVPNGITLPSEDQLTPHQEIKKERIVLCPARSASRQELESLLKLWAKIKPEGWRLRLVGVEDASLQEHLNRLAGNLRISGCLEISGVLFGLSHQHSYRTADILLLPATAAQQSENITDAMARGLPVIAVSNASGLEPQQENCGWAIPSGGDLAAVLENATGLSATERGAMGKRARTLIEHKYQWAAVGQNMLRSYGWLLGENDRPDCVLEG